MRYAIFSDIHGNLEALNAVVASAEARGVEKYICVGDIVGYNANPSECLSVVQSLDLAAIVLGNNDEYMSDDANFLSVNETAMNSISWTRQQLSEDQRAWLRQLEIKVVKSEDNITVVHATLDSPEAWGYIYDVYHAEDNFTYQTTQICFCGHSHVPVLYKKGFSAEEGIFGVFEVKDWNKPSIYENVSEVTISVDFGCKYLVNVGSVGQPRNGDNRATFVIYNSGKRTLERICVEYDIASAQEKIRIAGLPELLALRLEQGV